MNIKPIIGIGTIKFGITEEVLISIFDKPDSIDKEEYIEGTGDWYKVYWYFSRNIHFTFDKEDGYRLCTITILGSGYPLFGMDLFSLPLETVKKLIAKETKEIPKLEDWSVDDIETHMCLKHDGLGILFWFDSGDLSEMQCGYLFENDNETTIWP